MKKIFIHGLGQTPASWEKTICQLQNRNQIVCPNLAKLIQGEEVNYKNLYKAFSDICDEIEDSIHLCGLSLGGVMALNYAIDHPEKVRSLVLMAAQYKMPKKLLQFQNMLFRFMPKSMFEEMGFGKSEFLQLCETMMELDFTSLLHKVSSPVLVVYGEKDNANKKASVELADILENAKLQVIKGAGHEINVDAPEALAKEIDKFYATVTIEINKC